MFGDLLNAYWKANDVTPYSWEVKTYHMDYFTNFKNDINTLYVIYPDTMSSEDVNRINKAVYPMYDVVARISNHVCYALASDVKKYRLYDEYRCLSTNTCERLIHKYNKACSIGTLNHFMKEYGSLALNDLLAGIMDAFGSLLSSKINMVE